jgi:multidrug efflux pump subunit AcrA (membrane-fusion protein)
MNTSKLIAKAHIVQSEAVLLNVGGEASIQIPGVDEPMKGRVMLVSPALDPGSTTIEVWIEALHPGPRLKPGMNVSIEAVARRLKDALVVPTSAVFQSAEAGDYVLVAGSDNKAHQTTVAVGIRTKQFTEIQSGLKEKTPVITAGGYGVPDGTKITIETSPPAESDKAADKKEGGDSKAEGAPPKEKD